MVVWGGNFQFCYSLSSMSCGLQNMPGNEYTSRSNGNGRGDGGGKRSGRGKAGGLVSKARGTSEYFSRRKHPANSPGRTGRTEPGWSSGSFSLRSRLRRALLEPLGAQAVTSLRPTSKAQGHRSTSSLAPQYKGTETKVWVGRACWYPRGSRPALCHAFRTGG